MATMNSLYPVWKAVSVRNREQEIQVAIIPSAAYPQR